MNEITAWTPIVGTPINQVITSYSDDVSIFVATRHPYIYKGFVFVLQCTAYRGLEVLSHSSYSCRMHAHAIHVHTSEQCTVYTGTYVHLIQPLYTPHNALTHHPTTPPSTGTYEEGLAALQNQQTENLPTFDKDALVFLQAMVQIIRTRAVSPFKLLLERSVFSTYQAQDLPHIGLVSIDNEDAWGVLLKAEGGSRKEPRVSGW